MTKSGLATSCILDVHGDVGGMPPTMASIDEWLTRNGIDHSTPWVVGDRHFVISIDLTKDIKGAL